VELKFHKRVQSDLNQIRRKYHDASPQLEADFWVEFQIGLRKALQNPRFFHFDHSGLRRCNLDRFPYHFLYDIREPFIRIWVVRHNRRNPDFGLTRFSS